MFFMVSTNTALLLLSMSEILSSACRLICLSSLSLLSHLLPSSHLPELLSASAPSPHSLSSSQPRLSLLWPICSQLSLPELTKSGNPECACPSVSPLPAWPISFHSPALPPGAPSVSLHLSSGY